MPYTYQQADRAFKNDEIRKLGLDPDGMRFLKLRSLSRKEHLNRLIEDHGLDIPDGKPTARLKAVFESRVTDVQIDTTIRTIAGSERQQRAALTALRRLSLTTTSRRSVRLMIFKRV